MSNWRWWERMRHTNTHTQNNELESKTKTAKQKGTFVNRTTIGIQLKRIFGLSLTLSLFLSFFIYTKFFILSERWYYISTGEPNVFQYGRSLVRAYTTEYERNNNVEWWQPLMVESRNIFLSLIPVINKHNLPPMSCGCLTFQPLPLLLLLLVVVRCVFFVIWIIFCRACFSAQPSGGRIKASAAKMVGMLWKWRHRNISFVNTNTYTLLMMGNSWCHSWLRTFYVLFFGGRYSLGLFVFILILIPRQHSTQNGLYFWWKCLSLGSAFAFCWQKFHTNKHNWLHSMALESLVW